MEEEIKRKISETLKKKGIKPPSRLGVKHSVKTKRKMSLAALGKHKFWLGKKFSKEHRTKLGMKNIGDKCHLWRGGITPINAKIRQSSEYKLWRTAVFQRDSYQCVWGGKEHGDKLHADHIKSFSQFPELRFAIGNGRTLCVECHRKTDTWGGRTKNKST